MKYKITREGITKITSFWGARALELHLNPFVGDVLSYLNRSRRRQRRGQTREQIQEYFGRQRARKEEISSAIRILMRKGYVIREIEKGEAEKKNKRKA